MNGTDCPFAVAVLGDDVTPYTNIPPSVIVVSYPGLGPCTHVSVD
jgi:hypothetical protein